jgi:hypothetical protein
MNCFLTFLLPTTFSLLSIGTPASALQSPSQQKPTADPNERICEDIVLTGSRLATKRFCGTRAEWADRKKQDREAIEKAQLSPCVLTQNGGSGKPAC